MDGRHAASAATAFVRQLLVAELTPAGSLDTSFNSEKKHGHKVTVTVTKTLKAKFTVC